MPAAGLLSRLKRAELASLCPISFDNRDREASSTLAAGCSAVPPSPPPPPSLTADRAPAAPAPDRVPLRYPAPRRGSPHRKFRWDSTLPCSAPSPFHRPSIRDIR